CRGRTGGACRSASGGADRSGSGGCRPARGAVVRAAAGGEASLREARCEAAPAANPMSSVLGDPPLTTRRRGTVLVVDDEEGVRASIRAILEETCEVLEAEHGAAALEILAQREIDLVMLDQRMPGEAGVDVLPPVKAL